MLKKNLLNQTLQKEFSPHFLEIIDDSEKHRGHASAKGQKESHFHITIVSDHFEPMSLLQRHKAVYSVIKTSFDNKWSVHSIVIKAYTKAESLKEL